ncbi:MAG: type II toxin-antitoxin system HicB family antitoxin [Chloroflexota bacterium]
MTAERILYLPIITELNDDGYLARCLDIQGAFAEGDTIEEAIFNCVDVIKLIIAYRVERGEPSGVSSMEYAPDMRLSVAMPIGVS